jgi:acetoin utilization protein AcuC
VKRLASRVIVLGGGGYNPWTVGRCWAAIWGELNDLAVPDRLPLSAEQVLRSLNYDRAAGRNPPEHWFTTLRDAPREGPVRPLVRELAEIALEEGLPA